MDSYDLSDPLFRRLPISFRAHNCEVYTDQIDTIIRIFILFFCDSILLLLISILMYICNFMKLFKIVPHRDHCT